MAKREALKALQERLAQRMSEAKSADRSAAWLAVNVAGMGLLFPLAEAGEIFPISHVVPVAHTQPWFLGVANLRGHLHGVVHLAKFLGLPAQPNPEPGRDTSQLIALGAALEVNSAVWVDGLEGLRRQDQLRLLPAETAQADGAALPLPPTFAGDKYEDEQGRVWQVLNLRELAHHDAFLSILA